MLGQRWVGLENRDAPRKVAIQWASGNPLAKLKELYVLGQSSKVSGTGDVGFW